MSKINASFYSDGICVVNAKIQYLSTRNSNTILIQAIRINLYSKYEQLRMTALWYSSYEWSNKFIPKWLKILVLCIDISIASCVVLFSFHNISRVIFRIFNEITMWFYDYDDNIRTVYSSGLYSVVKIAFLQCHFMLIWLHLL